MNERENFINNLERAMNSAYGEGREFIKLTIGDVKRILQLLKEQDNCENCAIAIEDRQPVIWCKDCKYQSQDRASDEPDCSARRKEYEWEPNDWF